ncbi:hypothetical protein AS589_15930 [Empedobacter brevis]|nr:hypothetical protein AS589_15930 [Empedobacter brevis]
MDLISSLSLNVGRKTGCPYFRNTRLYTFKTTGSPACLTAGMQENKSAGMTESLLSEYHVRLSDGMTDGAEERKVASLPDKMPE